MQNRSLSTIAVALFTVCALTSSAPRATGAQSVAPLTGTFQAVSVGVSPDGKRRIWEGHADGDIAGRVRLELEQVGPPGAETNPVWRVRVRWTLDAAEARSFVADLEGVVVWQANLVRLAGTISSGWMAGAELEQKGRIVNGDISGSLTITP